MKNIKLLDIEIYQYSFTIYLDELKKIVTQKSKYNMSLSINYNLSDENMDRNAILTVKNIKRLLHFNYISFGGIHSHFAYDYKIKLERGHYINQIELHKFRIHNVLKLNESNIDHNKVKECKYLNFSKIKKIHNLIINKKNSHLYF
ncbi:hypothetical protein HZS_7933 [Henneguya salminicola]|nr:hypothetical protein HZS_7933 [Henneguya salminicola]